jgi:tetratricopeptide (TPR) repeat protein
VGLAELARRRGDYDGAARELDAALADARLDSAGRERVGGMKVAYEAERGTASSLEARIASGEAAPEDFHALAAVYADRFDWRRAAEVEARSGPAGSARERLAYYLLKSDRYREAHDLYAELARTTPKANLELNAGIALAGLGDEEGAIEAYRRAAALDPSESRANLYIGNAMLRLGRRSEAATAYRAYASVAGGTPVGERVRRILEQIAPPDPKPEARP